MPDVNRVVIHGVQRTLDWKPDDHDPRDFKFEAPSTITIPDLVNLTRYESPIKDQGQEGSCTAFGISGLLEYKYWNLTTPQKLIFSPLFIYYNERVIEGTINEDSGAQIRTGMKVIANQGACQEVTWPYSDKSEAMIRKPSEAAYNEALSFKTSNYYRVTGLQAMLACLAQKRPFTCGIILYESFDSDAVARTGMVPMPGTREQVLGGHCVDCVGYSKPQKLFIMRNSWGVNWGKCLVGDTKIQLLNGQSVDIESLAKSGERVWVYSYDLESSKIVPALAEPKKTGYRNNFVKVTLDNGETVTCTEDHLWMQRDGSYIEAGKLSEGQSLMPLYRNVDNGYVSIYSPKSHKWITDHWSVARHVGLRAESSLHCKDYCIGDGCRLIVHHKDFSGHNNDPNNLQVMYECQHKDLHATIGRPYKSERMIALWEQNYSKWVVNSRAQLNAYNDAVRDGLVPLTDRQIASRSENGQKLGCLPKGPTTERQSEARRINGKTAGSAPKSQETRQRLRDANIGHKHSDDTRAKMVQSHQGKTHSPETLLRMSESAKLRWARQREENLFLNHKVVSVERLGIWLPVYDLVVPAYNNFAISAGVFIHNSGHFYLPFDYLTNPNYGSDMWTIRG